MNLNFEPQSLTWQWAHLLNTNLFDLIDSFHGPLGQTRNKYADTHSFLHAGQHQEDLTKIEIMTDVCICLLVIENILISVR